MGTNDAESLARRLTCAAEQGWVKMVRFILAYGVSADGVVDKESGLRPLALACRHGHEEIAYLLLEKDADTTGAMAEAAYYHHKFLVELLLFRNASRRNAVTEAASGGSLEIVKLLVDGHGLSPNEGEPHPLYSARARENDGIHAFLVSRGARVE